MGGTDATERTDSGGVAPTVPAPEPPDAAEAWHAPDALARARRCGATLSRFRVSSRFA